jgi:hypothetical protein
MSYSSIAFGGVQMGAAAPPTSDACAVNSLLENPRPSSSFALQRKQIDTPHNDTCGSCGELMSVCQSEHVCVKPLSTGLRAQGGCEPKRHKCGGRSNQQLQMLVETRARQKATTLLRLQHRRRRRCCLRSPRRPQQSPYPAAQPSTSQPPPHRPTHTPAAAAHSAAQRTSRAPEGAGWPPPCPPQPGPLPGSPNTAVRRRRGHLHPLARGKRGAGCQDQVERRLLLWAARHDGGEGDLGQRQLLQVCVGWIVRQAFDAARSSSSARSSAAALARCRVLVGGIPDLALLLHWLLRRWALFGVHMGRCLRMGPRGKVS